MVRRENEEYVTGELDTTSTEPIDYKTLLITRLDEATSGTPGTMEMLRRLSIVKALLYPRWDDAFRVDLETLNAEREASEAKGSDYSEEFAIGLLKSIMACMDRRKLLGDKEFS